MEDVAERFGSQTLMAERLGVSIGFVSDVVRGRRLLSPRMAARIAWTLRDTALGKEILEDQIRRRGEEWMAVYQSAYRALERLG